MTSFFSRLKDKKVKKAAINELVDHSKHQVSFYLLLLSATVLAIGGVFFDNIPLLIASMIVAPLASPILTIGFSLSVLDFRLLIKTVGVLCVGSIVAVGIAFTVTYIFEINHVQGNFVDYTDDNHILSFVVAVVAGIVAAYGTLQPKIANAITGTAIAVSLLPPLVAVGIGMAAKEMEMASSAAIIFGLNILGIIIASLITYMILGVAKDYKPNK